MKRLVTVKIDKCKNCPNFVFSSDMSSAYCGNEQRLIIKSEDDYLCPEDINIPSWCTLPIV